MTLLLLFTMQLDHLQSVISAAAICVCVYLVMATRYEMQPQATIGPPEATPRGALVFTGSQIRSVTGRYPSVCINDSGKIVEVHQPSFGALWSNSLHYQVGTLLDDYTVRWSEVAKDDLAHYDGKFAAVSLNNRNTVVIVYEVNRKIRYHIGVLNLTIDKVNWSRCAERITWGRNPVVALNNKGQAVVAYESNFGYRTYYRTAQFQSESGNNRAGINWSRVERKLFIEGTNELSLAVNQTGCIVAAARGYGDKIFFKIGEMPATDIQNPFPRINWEDKSHRAVAVSKCRPVVSIDDQKHIIVAYQSNSGRQLSYQVGKISQNNEDIAWLHQPRNYDMGCNPTIALCNNGKWFEEHETNSAYRGHKLFYRVGELHESDAVNASEINHPGNGDGPANKLCGENEGDD